MKSAKHFLAVLLVIATMLSLVPTVAASERRNAQTQTDVRFEGTNSFGTMLSNELMSETDDEDPSWISSVTFDGDMAEVNILTDRDVTVLIGIFDEKTEELVTSATIDCTAEDRIVTVQVPNLPESFMI